LSNTAISAAAMMQANAAQQAADEAARVACATLVKGYEHNTATVAEMVQYADCIERLYPSVQDFSGIKPFLAVAFFLFFAGFLFGFIKRARYDDTFDKFMIGMGWGLIAVAAPLGVVCFIVSVRWLFF
jgi:energy-converting hydrogenase Eha subunit G